MKLHIDNEWVNNSSLLFDMLTTDHVISSNEKERKILAYTTWLTLLLVPVYGVTDTKVWYGTTQETVFLWAWMGIIRYQVNEFYDFSEQTTVIGFPWVYILHIPSYYLLQQSWKIYKENEKTVERSVYAISAIVVQILLIYMTFHSQDPSPLVNEEVRALYFPQWILLAFYIGFASKWYTQQAKSALENAKKSKSIDSGETDSTELTNPEEIKAKKWDPEEFKKS